MKYDRAKVIDDALVAVDQDCHCQCHAWLTKGDYDWEMRVMVEGEDYQLYQTAEVTERDAVVVAAEMMAKTVGELEIVVEQMMREAVPVVGVVSEAGADPTAAYVA